MVTTHNVEQTSYTHLYNQQFLRAHFGIAEGLSCRTIMNPVDVEIYIEVYLLCKITFHHILSKLR